MFDPWAALSGVATYAGIGVVLLLADATAGAVVWFVMGGLGALAVVSEYSSGGSSRSG